jgi:hypothetical protein
VSSICSTFKGELHCSTRRLLLRSSIGYDCVTYISQTDGAESESVKPFRIDLSVSVEMRGNVWASQLIAVFAYPLVCLPLTHLISA